jgi:uncharacterized membrane protein YbaN (DUF454 family)
MISLALAYVGIVTPGIPFSHFVVFAAFCFSKSSKRMEAWLYNHKWFGKFLTGWRDHKVFPLKMKYVMLAMMSSSLVILWFTTQNWKAVTATAIVMVAVAVWSWRYPSTVEEAEARKNTIKSK